MSESGQAAGDVRRGRQRLKINYPVLSYLCLIHVIAASAFLLPVRASHVALAVLIYFSIGFSTTLGLHRLLSHRSFQCPKWLEYLLVTLAMLTGQGSPLLWVANHRIHHGRSDREGDIHSPRRGFWYGHVLRVIDDASTDSLAYRKYCKDLAGDRYYHWLVRYRLAPQAAAVALVVFTLGWAAVPLVFFLPVVCWMHSTHAVNSVCHDARFGSRLFETRERSRQIDRLQLYKPFIFYTVALFLLQAGVVTSGASSAASAAALFCGGLLTWGLYEYAVHRWVLHRETREDGFNLPGTVSRDYDGYTLCHRPTGMAPGEVIAHFRRLCRQLGSLTNVARHYGSKLGASRMPNYKKVILASGPEILSVRNPIGNAERKYIAGLDPIEEWDRHMMEELRLPLQPLSPQAQAAGPEVLSGALRAVSPAAFLNTPRPGLAAASQ